MQSDQVEILAHERTQDKSYYPVEVQRLLSWIRIQKPAERRGQTVLDQVAQEPEAVNPPGEKPAVQTLLGTLEWSGVVLVIGSLAMLMWAVIFDAVVF